MTDSSEKLEAIASALDSLAEAINNATNTNQTLLETNGWNFPPLGKKDISTAVEARAEKVRAVDPKRLNAKFSETALVNKINLTRTNVVQYLFNGNGSAAAPGIFFLLDYIDLNRPGFAGGSNF